LGAASKIALAVVMVFFVVFANAFHGRARGRQEPDANARYSGASDWQMTRAVVIPRSVVDSRQPACQLRFRAGRCHRRRIPGRGEGMGLLIATARVRSIPTAFRGDDRDRGGALIAEWLLP